MNSQEANHERTTVFLRDLPAHVEEGLIERAAANGRNPGDEAADIIERHIEDGGDEII